MNDNFCLNRHDRNTPEIQDWWLEVFKTLPTNKNDFHAKEVIPLGILHRVKRILGIEDEPEHIFIENKNESVPVQNEETDAITAESNIEVDDMLCRGTASPIKLDDIEQKKANSYIRFFRRPEYKATIWRENKVYSKDQMTLSEQSRAVSESIAKKFVGWITTIGGEEQSSVSVESIVKMFDIGTKLECANACKVKPKEIQSAVNIAKTKRTILNVKIPTTKQFVRNRKSRRDIIHERLETMEMVWKGIIQLKSTHDFLEYLSSNHPDVKPPRYLIENDVMTK